MRPKFAPLQLCYTSKRGVLDTQVYNSQKEGNTSVNKKAIDDGRALFERERLKESRARRMRWPLKPSLPIVRISMPNLTERVAF